MARLLEVGRVIRPHGIRGEVIVELVTNRTERLAPGSRLFAGEREVEVAGSRPHKGRYIVAFAGVADRDAAEELRGALLRAEPLVDPGALWVHELIGAAVVDVAGRAHGTVEAVEANPAADLLVLSSGALVPVTFVVEAGAGRVVVDPPPGLLPEGRR
jgi:16S rRNA processing protein RimM